MDIGPGTPLIAKAWYKPGNWYTFVCEPLTEGALYSCSEIYDYLGRGICPWDECGSVAVSLRGKLTAYGNPVHYCPNLFRPLNDGDTSLIQNEVEVETEIMEPVYV